MPHSHKTSKESGATHKMYYVSGGGTEYDGGLWQVKATDKTVQFSCLKDPYFDSQMPLEVRISRNKEHKHCLRDWGDGDYTVYPNQSGTPHVFTKVEESQ